TGSSSFTNTFLYDGLNPIQVSAGTAATTTNLLTGLGIDEYFATIDSTGAAQAFLTDGLGSTLALADPNSPPTAPQYSYEPFGKSSNAGGPTLFQFTGRENDGIGVDYFRARYYHPTFGRFVSEDPLDWAGGDANLYAYAFNNPLGWIDPLGLLSMCYDYSNLHLYDDDGNQIGSYPGTSGNAGSGAIPRGRYKLVPR